MTCAAAHIDCRQKLSNSTIKSLKCFLCNKQGHTPRKCPIAFPPPLPVEQYIAIAAKRQMKRQRQSTKLYTPPSLPRDSTQKRRRADADTTYVQAARRGNAHIADTQSTSQSEVEELKAQLKAALQLNQHLTKRVEQLEQRSQPSHSHPPTQPAAAPTTQPPAQPSTPPTSTSPRQKKQRKASSIPTESSVVQQLATSVQQIKQWMNTMTTSMSDLKSSVETLAIKHRNTVRLKVPTKQTVSTSNTFAPLSQPIDIEAQSETTSSGSTANPSQPSIPHDL
jgi:hypothetical protein